MAQQEISSDQIKDFEIVDGDISGSAGIGEAKISFDDDDGHDHDLVGKRTLGVILAKRLRVTPTSPTPNLRVQVSGSSGINFPTGVSPDVADQSYNFTPLLPIGTDKRIDLLFLDSAGLIQRKIGVVHSTSPVAPSHTGVFPIAEIGPLTATTTAITESLIKDVRPFLSANSTVEVLDSSNASLGFATAIKSGTNVTISFSNGVATVSSTGGGSVVSDASTTVKGIVKVSVNPPSGDPVALEVHDSRVALAENSIQKDGSVAFTGDINFGGHNVANINNATVDGNLTFSDNATISTTNNGNLTIAPNGNGKVIVDSNAAMQLPEIAGTPPMPGLGDIWFDPGADAVTIRTANGIKSMAVAQVGVLGIAVSEIIGDSVSPPTVGSVGNIPTINFPNDGTTRTIHFAFQLPEDAVLTDVVKIRINYAGSASGAGNYRMSYSYTAVAQNATLVPGSATGTGNFTITPVNTGADIFEYDESFSIPGGTLLSRSEVSVSLSRASADGADTKNADLKILNIIVLYSKKDIVSERNVIEVSDEGTDLGQVKKINFVGNLVSVTAAGSDATVTVNDISVNKATTGSHGIVRVIPAPADAAQVIVVGTNDTRLPSQDENDALLGTSGTPSNSNRYVTASDVRLVSVDQGDALGGTSGTPSSTNKYVTDADPRLPTTAQKAALVGAGATAAGSGNKYVLEDNTVLPTANQKAGLAGVGATAVSGSNKYVLQDNTVLPSQDENDALQGTSGTPSNSNRFVTNADTRLLTTDQDAALAGTAGTPSSSNPYVTTEDTRLPTSAQKAALVGAGATAASGSNKYVLEDNIRLLTSDQDDALVGTTGTPSSINKFVTSTDPRVPSQGENDALVGTAGTPSTANKYVTDSDARIPTTDQIAAMAGTSGTPSTSNRFVTAADSKLLTTDEKAALVGTNGTPSSSNKFVTNSDPRLPVTDEKAALAGDGISSASDTNRYVLSDNAKLPTAGEKSAMQGTTGSPGNSNRFVTQTYGLLPTAGEKAALAGAGASAAGGGNKYVLQDNTVLPTQGENDALVGTSGTPGTGNPFVTTQDTRLPSQGENDALTGTSGTPSSTNRYITSADTTYTRTDGSRSFTGPVGGVDPTASNHLVTRSYVDFVSTSLGGQYGSHVNDLPELRAVPPASRVDKQLRLVESEGAIYRFDIEASGGGEAPNAGTGQWYKVQAATQSHNSLLGLQGGTSGEYYHLAANELTQLIGGANTALHFHNADRVTVERNNSAVVTNATSINFSTLFDVAASGAQADVGIPVATTIRDGVMSTTMVTKLAGIEAGAQVNPTFSTGLLNTTGTITVVYGSSSGSAVQGNDTRVPTQSENDALVGSGVAGPSSSNKYVLQDSPAVLTTDQQAAVLGSNGPPNNSNKFVTEDDPRILTLNQAVAMLGTSGTPGIGNAFVTEVDPRVPTQSENDALQGTNGTPSGSNRYVTNSDSRNTDHRIQKLLHAPTYTDLNGGTLAGSYVCTSMGTLSVLNSSAVAGDTIFFDILFRITPNSGSTTRDLVFATDETGLPTPVARITETIATTSNTPLTLRWIFNLCVLATTGSNNVLVQGYNISNAGFITHYTPSLFTLAVASSSFDLQIGMTNISDGQVDAYIGCWRGRV